MIAYLNKDLTSVTRGVVVHGCNAQGAMGSGVAAALVKRWPQIYEGYNALCKSASDKQTILGTSHFVTITDGALIIGNLITQQTYGPQPYGRSIAYASPEAIEKSLRTAFSMADLNNLPLYMPKIGCLRGGLNWEKDVLPIVEQLDKEFELMEIYVCDI